ncbi:hypothetical protein EW146_g6930 [Bondarzewia mesenterica]|uniref:Uncharacterized protein n=1 Tax=Bondarzewia mesenterica TaxID=1095465 RepID=A0A4S4LM55_9AGAM|nr:hypothetical protein EW146_g6930 [Bondarzewia mesenterica]
MPPADQKGPLSPTTSPLPPTLLVVNPAAGPAFPTTLADADTTITHLTKKLKFLDERVVFLEDLFEDYQWTSNDNHRLYLTSLNHQFTMITRLEEMTGVQPLLIPPIPGPCLSCSSIPVLAEAMPHAPPLTTSLFTHEVKDERMMNVRVEDKEMGEELGLGEGPIDLDPKADADGEADPNEDSILMDEGRVTGMPVIGEEASARAITDSDEDQLEDDTPV